MLRMLIWNRASETAGVTSRWTASHSNRRHADGGNQRERENRPSRLHHVNLTKNKRSMPPPGPGRVELDQLVQDLRRTPQF